MSHPAKKVKFYRAVDGSPPYEIVSRGKKYKLINDQELVIMKVSLIDHGTYICRAENHALKDKKIKLFINNCKSLFAYFFLYSYIINFLLFLSLLEVPVSFKANVTL